MQKITLEIKLDEELDEAGIEELQYSIMESFEAESVEVMEIIYEDESGEL